MSSLEDMAKLLTMGLSEDNESANYFLTLNPDIYIYI